MAHTSGRVFNWDEWNAEAYERIDHYVNKYDRGICTTPYISGGETPSPTASPDLTGYCPKIDSIQILPCSKIEIYIQGGSSV